MTLLLSHLGLNADHCALLVVLWSYLSLQKRTATESREVPGQNALFASDRAEAAKKYLPSVRIETIAREFRRLRVDHVALSTDRDWLLDLGRRLR